MSMHSDPIEFDLWDAVCCSRCQLPFLSKAAPTIPFWLTECGHVLCNNHLNPDQSCSQCGAQEIQLIPLQKEMEAPMSDWFRSIPSAFDSLVYSVKFQQEMMISQIMSLRSRCQQQRVLIDRLRAENAELKKKSNEDLRNVNPEFRPHANLAEGHARRLSETINSNGKRPRNNQFDELIPKTTAGLRRELNPTDSDEFAFSRRHILGTANEEKYYQEPQPDLYDSVREATKPEQLAKQYAYKMPPTLHDQYKPPPLSRAQAAPLAYQQRTHQYSRNAVISTTDSGGQGFASHGRPPSRFKPAKLSHGAMNHTADSKFEKVADQEAKKMRTMGPPPTPQHLRHQRQQEMQQSGIPGSGASHNASSGSTNRFLPSSNGHASNIPTPSNRRFLPPPTPLNGKTQHSTRGTVSTDTSGRAINTRKGQ